MPTGYTCVIDDNPNCTFKDYALRCVRAFGAAAHMRDDSIGKTYEPRVPSVSYHEDAIKQAKADKARLQMATSAELRKEYDAECVAEMARWRKNESERIEMNARYERMAVEVMAWKPPTPDHNNLKEFMLSQLKEGRSYGSSPYPPPEPPTFDEWVADWERSIERDIEYHTKEIEKEVTCCKEANEWVQKVLESLKSP